MDVNHQTATCAQLAFLNPREPIEISRANLPHWRQEGTVYYVTFRLADSLPKKRLDQWLASRRQWLAEHREPRSIEKQVEYHKRFSLVLETWLDQGHGSCLLQLPDCRQLVVDAIRHFADKRYALYDGVVAANHVHVVVTPHPGRELSSILRTWKSYSAKKIATLPDAAKRLRNWWNAINRRRGESTRMRPVWQKESYDHIIRSAAALRRIEDYIHAHPTGEPWR